MNSYTIRPAKINDAETILTFIKELAAYEKLEEHVVGTTHDIINTFFCDNPRVEAVILEENNEPVGSAIYFHNYSTFLCRHGIYIEDIYVQEKHRGKGYGKALLKHICEIAHARNCGRVEWWCLDWNKPSIDFYLSLGAEAMTDWTVYRLNEQQLKNLK